jgi:hypothetical protein
MKRIGSKAKPVITLNQLNYNVYKDDLKNKNDLKTEKENKIDKNILNYINIEKKDNVITFD